MADEDITLDGKPLQSLRVADLKAALEQRNLPKSGQKNTLLKRLKGALMLENLQKSSSSNSGLQPNSQIGEEMCQNSFIKQYLAKQQELLRQRLEREAQQEEEADESPGGPEEDEDHSEDNDNCSYVSKHRTMLPQSFIAKPGFRGDESMIGHGSGPTMQHQESAEAPGPRMQRGQGHKEPPAPSPPRAVASLSVRVLGQPGCQVLPPAVPPSQEKESTAPSELGSAHSILHFSRSARSSAGNHVHDDSDDEDDDDESDKDEDWGPAQGRGQRRKKATAPMLQMAPSVPLAAARSKRKLQPPQHIPPAQAHHAPLQLRHPTPPPSPPPNLFPLPDTPKQSPPDTDDQEGEGPAMQKQYSDSSSRSSSPELPGLRKPGPLSLLIHKMESEEATSTPGMSREAHQSTAGCSSESPLQGSASKRQQESREKEEKERERQQELEMERRKIQEQERQRNLEKEKENKRKQLEEEKTKKCLEGEKRREEKQLKGEKEQEKAYKGRVVVSEAQDTGSSSESDSKSDSSSRSSQSSSSEEKTKPTNQLKKRDQRKEVDDEKNFSKGLEKQYPSKREVSEPSTAAITEVEPDSESSMAEQPVSSAEPENSESRLEEVPMPLPLPLLVSAAYYYYHHQHLFHSSYSYNSCPTMRKCIAGT